MHEITQRTDIEILNKLNNIKKSYKRFQIFGIIPHQSSQLQSSVM